MPTFGRVFGIGRGTEGFEVKRISSGELVAIWIGVLIVASAVSSIGKSANPSLSNSMIQESVQTETAAPIKPGAKVVKPIASD